MNPNIYIELFRVSADGEYLDVIIDCPVGYLFTKFDLTADYKNAKGEQQLDTFNIGDSTFMELDEVLNDGSYKYKWSTKNHWVIRISIKEQLGIEVPAIYTATFGALKISKSANHIWIDGSDGDDWNPENFGEEDAVYHIMHEIPGPKILSEVTAVCSDVSNMYRNILDSVINNTGVCDKVSDEAIRNYLILYAHQEAMRMNEMSDAILYFNMINNNFNKCGTFSRLGTGPSCGCSSNQSSSSVSRTYSKSGGSSCGCGKK